ncbi:DUF6934 family protein [Pedobacter africanus]|uniref:Uncharacterized protein n=1 Tax=Pedobacter africanus TaxID=151894 RepID=A0A1W2CTK8_9SPHI|nr:hypothetical protein [Pedobacter africanus]SMC88553.1 hypothetical protein SAMN04488524_3204 [Pedobacter africanus]
MQEDRYSYNKADSLSYTFISNGPNGNIKKIVVLEAISDDKCLYNLAFGDLNKDTGEIDDLAKSNNSDTQKILSTVAAIAADFLTRNPNVQLLATGSTASRTRLYRIGITRFWNEINTLFEVKGYINAHWESFQKGKTYNAFLVTRKK